MENIDNNEHYKVPVETPEKPKIEVPAPSIRQLRKETYRKAIRWIWGFYLVGFVSVFVLFFSLSFQLPSFEQLENPKVRIATEIYASDGVLLGKYYIENRTPVPYDSISPHVINALVSTEDARFYSHSGIDPEALGRVLVKTIIFQQRNAGGGSTISQQLAKLLVGRPDTKNMSTPVRYWTLFTTKLKEWLTAVKLERAYTKQEILTMYLNEFDFLYGANGIRSASETYFSKQPIDLTITESAMLVRMLKNPSMYNYRRDMDQAMLGREVVLKNMVDKKHITREQYDKLRVEPIDVSKFSVMDHNQGSATYFREYLREYVKEVLSRKENLKANGQPYDVYRDGLKIYTTINSRMQNHLEQAVWDHLSQHQIKMFAHWKDWNMIDPPIGTDKNNPWTFKTYENTLAEIEMRLVALSKLVWSSERYIGMRDQLKTAKKHKLRDIDIYRMLHIEKHNKTPIRDPAFPGKPVTGEAILAKWEETGYATNGQIRQYRNLMKSSDWQAIKSEYEGIMKSMQTPIEMKIFSYVKENGKWRGGEKDTIMSPFDSIKYHRMMLQAGSIAIEPQTGYVRAWVGGVDHNYFQLDHVSMGALYVHPEKRIPGKTYQRPGRQVGSSIKPFLYSLNIDLRGYSPCYEVVDEKITIEKGFGKFGLIKDWTPSNAGGKYSNEKITLVQALRLSLNSVSAQLMKDLNSAERFRAFLHDVGMDTAKVPASPTICLGTPDLTPLEMAGGYTIFANGGVYSEPIFIDRIEDRNGNPIYSAEADQIVEQVLTESGAFVMSEMLKAVQAGAPGFAGIKSQHGGKTGTTNFQSDGWFLGITPNLVVGTWVGNDDRFIRFRTLQYGQGGTMARPIFQNMLKYLEADPALEFDTKARFPRPDDIEIEMNCLKYEGLKGHGDTFDDRDVFTNSGETYIEDYDEPKKDKKKPTKTTPDGTR